jgi:hypothetical protein
MPLLRRDLFQGGFFLHRRAQEIAAAPRLISYEVVGSLAGEIITSDLIERSTGTSRRTSAQTLLFSVRGVPWIKRQSMDTDPIMCSGSQSG